MDPALSSCVELDTPRLNPKLAEGLAVAHMGAAEAYIDQVFKLTAKGFPPGLVYCGYKRCTPQEELKERTRRRQNRCTFDIAVSHIYMVKYLFKYMDQDLPDVYLYLPFVNSAGTIMLGGSLFSIAPVMSDRVISVGVSNVFVRLIRGKVKFHRIPYQIKVNGKWETQQVNYGMIYNKNQRQSRYEPTVKAFSTLPHYLFAKFGATQTFQKYGKCTPVFGVDNITPMDYPETEWVICSSMQMKPKSFGRTYYEPTNIKIAIRKEEFTPLVKHLVAGFFYVADHFPQRIDAAYVDNTSIWKILLGHILRSGKINEGILLSEMSDHINSLDEYMDGPVALKLADIGIYIDTFYDLMVVVMEKFGDWIIDSTENINSLYNKELVVLDYVLYEITSAIITMYFKVRAAANKPLNEKEIINIFRSYLRTGLIFLITNEHGEISSTSYSGDNKAFKFTSILVQQNDSNRLRSRKSRAVLEDPSKRLHVSVAEVGGYSNIPKNEPSGRSRLNQFVQISDKNVIQRDPALKDLLDQVQQLIR